ncbi:MAG: hypothetical protein Q8L73_02625 [Methylotenera sp.]|nr:hypothetical protein [Methylotenera sp.]
MNKLLALLALACVSNAALAQVAAPSSLPGQTGSTPILQAPPVAMPMPVIKPVRQPQTPPDDLSMPSYPPPANASPPSASPASEQLPPTLHRPSPRMPATEPEPTTKKLPANLASQVSTGKKLQFRKTPVKITFEDDSSALPRVDVARLNQSLAGRFERIALDESDRDALKQFGLDIATDTFDSQPNEGMQPSAKIQTTRRASTGTMVQSKTLMGQPAPPGGQPAPPNFTTKPDGRMTAQINPEVWCERFANHEPRISRVLADADNLTPGMSFVLKGVCLGAKPGVIDVRFQGSNKAYRANVVNWGHNKILATLPDNIEGVPPTIVEIVVTTAGNRVTKPGFFTFEPKWNVVEVVDGLHRYSRVVTCSNSESPGYPFPRSWCEAGKNEIRGNGFVMPDYKWPLGFRSAIHYTEEDVEIVPTRGADRWAFDLPPHAVIKSWRVVQESFDNAKNTVRLVWDPSTRQIVANWSLADMGEQGFLRYTITEVYVLMPVGIPFYEKRQ